MSIPSIPSIPKVTFADEHPPIKAIDISSMAEPTHPLLVSALCKMLEAERLLSSYEDHVDEIHVRKLNLALYFLTEDLKSKLKYV